MHNFRWIPHASGPLAWAATMARATFASSSRTRRVLAATTLRGPTASRVRDARDGDLPFLYEMVLDAAFPPEPRPPVVEALSEPHVARMVDGWQRPGDAGVVGVVRGRRVGAAWYRTFSVEELRSGNASPEFPELAIAIDRHFRGCGWGRALLAALIARAERDGFGAIDLQVGERNTKARALYEGLGFDLVGEPEDGLIWMRRTLTVNAASSASRDDSTVASRDTARV